MVGPFHRRLMFLVLVVVSSGPGLLLAQDQGAASKPANDSVPRLAPGDYALPGEDPPRAFVPAHPRSVEEQKRIESLRYYATARAQEELRQFAEAIKTLEKAGDPNSALILRRLCRINYAMGREDNAISVGRRLLAVDPGDIETLALLINSYKDDPAAIETLLKQVASNPKLDKNSVGALYVEFELGNLYEASLQIDLAATAFAKVVDALDEKSNARIAASDLRRFLGAEESQAYLRFGRVFLQAKKPDLAIKSFQRGLVYDPNEPILLLYLARIYSETGQGQEALSYLERFLKQKPVGRDTYDFLAKILTDLKRENEIIPQLEKYVELNAENAPLQYALAERYKAAGEVEKSNAIYKKLRSEQRETLDFAENFPLLVKGRKTEEILVQLTKVVSRLKRFDPVQTQIEELVADPVYTDQVLDQGVKMLSANPSLLDPDIALEVLLKIATEGKRIEKIVPLYLWAIRREPNPRLFQNLAYTYYELNRFNDAVSTIKAMFEGFPESRTARNLFLIAEMQGRTNNPDQGIANAKEGLRQEPNDVVGIRVLVFLLSQSGKTDEAMETVKSALKLDPANSKLNLSLGSLLMGAERNKEALELFKVLVEKYPNNDELVKDARTMLSNIYTAMGDFPKAEAELEMLIAKDPEDPGVNNDLGYLYADQGKNLERAEAMIRKALKELPDNYAYLDSLGWVLFKRGKLDQARELLEKANGTTETDSTIPDHLGDVYFQLQEHAKAKSAWERALKIASQARPIDKRLPEIRKKLQSLQQFEPAPRPANGERP